VNFSDLLQQVYKNCNNQGQERITQSANADNGTYITHQNNRGFV